MTRLRLKPRRVIVGALAGLLAAVAVILTALIVICFAYPDSASLLSPLVDREGQPVGLRFLTDSQQPEPWSLFVHLYGPWLVAIGCAIACAAAAGTWVVSRGHYLRPAEP